MKPRHLGGPGLRELALMDRRGVWAVGNAYPLVASTSDNIELFLLRARRPLCLPMSSARCCQGTPSRAEDSRPTS
jgi:hypothetical protein